MMCNKHMTIAVSGSLLFLISLFAVANQPAKEAEDRRHEQALKLIEALVSKNPVPVIVDKWKEPTFPDNFSEAEEGRTAKAARILSEHFVEAMPEIIEHIGDDRYCFTREEGNGYWSNWTVGNVCHRILREHVAPYFNVISNRTRFNKELLSWDKEGVRRWWRLRNSLTLYDLQYEWVKWALQKELQNAFERTEQEREVLGELCAGLSQLCKTGKPIAVQIDFRLRPP